MIETSPSEATSLDVKSAEDDAITAARYTREHWLDAGVY